MSRAAGRHGPLSRALGQMRQDPWLQGVAISSLTVALAIVGAYLTLCLNLQQAGQRLATGSTLLVALVDTASPEDGRALAKELAGWPEVAEVRFVGKAQALSRFRQQLGTHAGLLEGLEDNPLPNTIELFLPPGAAPHQALEEKLKASPLVGEVITSRPWLHRLEEAAGALGEAAWVLGGLLFLGVVFLVANTVRLAVYVRRDQLEILDLVGARPAYVRWPFVLEAVLQACLAAGLATLLVWGLMQLLQAPAELPLGLDLSQLLRFPWQVPAALLGLAVLAGVLGGLLGVGRVLRPQRLA